MKYLLYLTLLMISTSALSKEKPYSIDTYLPQINLNEFYNQDKIRPKNSDFKINSTLAMSTDEGNRAVLINISNLSSGRRILEPEQIMVLYANGQAHLLTALPKKIILDGYQAVNLTLELGHNIYPVISVLTTNNIQ
ncbi:hypothetical protein [Pseudoalteromonas luteoviolacea]|uniref:Uncharacterized protein n=1 Tax=Pseudoalteromonas luteoviolacea S4054 TaxID=1129367 RepID=A0A0F6A601_9GAMM|nr:hypothetical protein [Pseudoalteromonas luteoviolacea]AOT10748.1 hypothetical protein S4054249_23115 [Pseudoalteromonas luteoviolacea]AOT16090.1 hypothetical protein S40542_25395 [Pseudoalteromonas luteoviolacea]AOT20568.1 hypothetical protein S4054_23030 [Pseudoalteromonas luteoviolacea]KKE81281.1 hypothetical protein N479_23155 [Pseudoalteromonas luteoviolacea S4054]KZN68956.1 hypothetical protein N481_22705 [Pseudoalteromonas luteoviolacea S4047-1]